MRVEADAVRVDLSLPERLAAAVERRLEGWREEGFAERLWRRDPTLWAPDAANLPAELADRLGWLGLPERALEEAAELAAFADEVRAEAAERVVLMGMGGSSLAPEVFQDVLGGGPGSPRLVLLDSTHPEAVTAVREEIDPATTIFVVASKSGTTAETMSLFHYLWRETAAGVDNPGSRFVAITDPGTPLADLAVERSFRRVYLAPPDVGGRYSALSVFGLVPAALVGLDVERLARGARDFGESALRRPADDNPGLRLAAVMAEAALLDPPRAALTFRVAPSLAAFPVWIEQLVAESLGKDGLGVLPVVDEPTRELDAYGPDRVFLRMGLREEIEEDDDAQREGGAEILRRITDAGHPVVTVTLADRWALGAAMLLWEVATAAAGAAMGVQPFDQPDVELAKVRGREALAGRAGGAAGTGGVEEVATDDPDALARAVKEWLGDPGPGAGRYVAIQAFLPPEPETDHAFQDLRAALAERLPGVATTAGYGPRFLHSTGQLHKGGPDTGLFLQLVDDVESAPAIPEGDAEGGGARHGFGDLVRAQAVGDYRALAERGRRILRVRLRGDRDTALEHLRSAVAVSPDVNDV